MYQKSNAYKVGVKNWLYTRLTVDRVLHKRSYAGTGQDMSKYWLRIGYV